MAGRGKRNIGGLYWAEVAASQAAAARELEVFRNMRALGVQPFEAWGMARSTLTPDEVMSIEVASQDAGGPIQTPWEKVRQRTYFEMEGPEGAVSLPADPRSAAAKVMFEYMAEPVDKDEIDMAYEVPLARSGIKIAPGGGVALVPEVQIDKAIPDEWAPEIVRRKVEDLAAADVPGAKESLEDGNEAEFLQGYLESVWE